MHGLSGLFVKSPLAGDAARRSESIAFAVGRELLARNLETWPEHEVLLQAIDGAIYLWALKEKTIGRMIGLRNSRFRYRISTAKIFASNTPFCD